MHISQSAQSSSASYSWSSPFICSLPFTYAAVTDSLRRWLACNEWFWLLFSLGRWVEWSSLVLPTSSSYLSWEILYCNTDCCWDCLRDVDALMLTIAYYCYNYSYYCNLSCICERVCNNYCACSCNPSRSYMRACIWRLVVSLSSSKLLIYLRPASLSCFSVSFSIVSDSFLIS